MDSNLDFVKKPLIFSKDIDLLLKERRRKEDNLENKLLSSGTEKSKQTTNLDLFYKNRRRLRICL